MFALLILGGITAGLVAWSKRDKVSGIGMGSPMGMSVIVGKELDGKKGKYEDSKTPPAFLGPPMQPEEERLLSLLTLWVKDKKFRPGQKRFMTKALATEAATLAARLGLAATARAILTDGPLPREKMGRRGITVREAILAFNSK